MRYLYKSQMINQHFFIMDKLNVQFMTASHSPKRARPRKQTKHKKSLGSGNHDLSCSFGNKYAKDTSQGEAETIPSKWYNQTEQKKSSQSNQRLEIKAKESKHKRPSSSGKPSRIREKTLDKSHEGTQKSKTQRAAKVPHIVHHHAGTEAERGETKPRRKREEQILKSNKLKMSGYATRHAMRAT